MKGYLENQSTFTLLFPKSNFPATIWRSRMLKMCQKEWRILLRWSKIMNIRKLWKVALFSLQKKLMIRTWSRELIASGGLLKILM